MDVQQTPDMALNQPMPNILDYTQPRILVNYTGNDSSSSSSDSDSDSEMCISRKMLKSLAMAIAIVLIIMILYYLLVPGTLSKKLAKCGWIVYYRQGCGFCTKQKQVLRGDFENYIECDMSGNQIGGYTTKPPIPCNSSVITGFPFWYNTRTKDTKVGLQTLESLKEMAKL